MSPRGTVWLGIFATALVLTAAVQPGESGLSRALLLSAAAAGLASAAMAWRSGTSLAAATAGVERLAAGDVGGEVAALAGDAAPLAIALQRLRRSMLPLAVKGKIAWSTVALPMAATPIAPPVESKELQVLKRQLDRFAEALSEGRVAPVDGDPSFTSINATVEILRRRAEQAELARHVTQSGMQTAADSLEGLAASATRLSSALHDAGQGAAGAQSAARAVNERIGLLSGATRQLATSSRQIAKDAAEATSTATEAQSVSQETYTAIAKLNESSQQIGETVKVINAIARQTNLLALNATIEAARAGEAGKGFGVVAGEVKVLAQQTAEATTSIASRIQVIETDMQSAVGLIYEIGAFIGQVNDIQQRVASAAAQQTVATASIAAAVIDVTDSSASLDGQVRDLSLALDASRHVAEALAAEAGGANNLAAYGAGAR